MLGYRVVPMLLLRGRELSPTAQRALELIPTAAFAALVANDFFKPELFAQGVWDGLLPACFRFGAVAIRAKPHCVRVVGVVAYYP